MATAFLPTRVNGKSDARVVIETVAEGDPGTVFDHDVLIAALQKNTARAISRSTVCAAVQAANRRLLKEYQRTLHSIRGVGYRLAAASDHTRLAQGRRRRADRQLAVGLATLQHVRWDEMDENARKAHEGQLMVMASLHQMVTAVQGRQDRLEELVTKMA